MRNVNLRQLQVLCEIVDSGLSVTDAAQAIHRSQSNVTRQLQLLEKELGLELFARNRNKLLSLTPQAEEIVSLARRILQDAENVLRIARNMANDERGPFTIATTNFQARYVLPPAVDRFVEKYPKVRLSLRQGTPAQCYELLALGKADVAICAGENIPEELAAIRCYRFYRSLLVPPGHPLLRVKQITLEALAEYPLITYDEAFSGASIIKKAFADKGLSPRIVLSAADADVSKIYVGRGMGIAIAASIAFDPKHDDNVRRIDARHLFKPSHLSIILRRHAHLRNFMVDFISMVAPKLDRRTVDEAVFRKNTPSVSRARLPEL